MICRICNKDVVNSIFNIKDICSKRCFTKFKLNENLNSTSDTITCPCCGKELNKRSQVFCSPSCARKSPINYYDSDYTLYNKNPNKCRCCNTIFSFKDKDKWYCDICTKEALKILDAEKYWATPNYCESCGTIIPYESKHKYHGRFCCNGCFVKHRDLGVKKKIHLDSI